MPLIAPARIDTGRLIVRLMGEALAGLLDHAFATMGRAGLLRNEWTTRRT